jgi:hypothetical protein
VTGDLTGATELLREAVQIATGNGYEGLIHEVQHALATSLTYQCRWVEAVDLLQQSTRLATELGSVIGMANGHWWIGRVALASVTEGASESLDAAQRYVEQSQIRRYDMYLEQDRARLALMSEEPHDAARHLDIASEIADQLDDDMARSDNASIAAALDLERGDPERASQRAAAVVAAKQASQDLLGEELAHLLLGEAYARLGRTEDAISELRLAESQSARTGNLMDEVRASAMLALLLPGSEGNDQLSSAKTGWAELTARRPVGAPVQGWERYRSKVFGPLEPGA